MDIYSLLIIWIILCLLIILATAALMLVRARQSGATTDLLRRSIKQLAADYESSPAKVSDIVPVAGLSRRGIPVANLATVSSGDSLLTLVANDAAMTGMVGADRDLLLSYAAAAYMGFDDRLAEACVKHAKKLDITLASTGEQHFDDDGSVEANVGGHLVLTGSKEALSKQKIDISGLASLANSLSKQERKLRYVAVDNELVGLIAFSDNSRSIWIALAAKRLLIFSLAAAAVVIGLALVCFIVMQAFPDFTYIRIWLLIGAFGLATLVMVFNAFNMKGLLK